MIPGQLELPLYPARADDATPSGAMWNRMVDTGSIDPSCATCQHYRGTADDPRPDTFAPTHRASARCQSGKRPHCTCDTCF